MHQLSIFILWRLSTKSQAGISDILVKKQRNYQKFIDNRAQRVYAIGNRYKKAGIRRSTLAFGAL